MCTIYTLKEHALLRKTRRENVHKSKANDIALLLRGMSRRALHNKA